jgi:hypothetical protein
MVTSSVRGALEDESRYAAANEWKMLSVA